MNKQLCRMIGMCSLVVLLGAPLWAQLAGTLTVRIPFEFTAGKYTLPAGNYTIAQEGGFVRLVSADKQHKAVLMPMQVERSRRPGESQLSFNRYGNAYFLSQIWSGKGIAGQQFAKTAHERELAKAASAQTETLIAGQ